MNEIMRILILEDLPSDAELAEHELSKVFNNYSTEIVETEEDYTSALELFKPNLIISDFQLPAFDGLSALKISLEKCPLIPFIILTGSMNEDTAVDCIKAGADDYVIKEHIKRLGTAALKAIEKKKKMQERHDALIALRESEKKYHVLYNNNPLSYQSLNADGSFIDVNQTWLRTLGYEREEVIGKNYADFLHLDWKKHFEENFPAFKKRGYVHDVQYKIRHKNGYYIDISFEGCIGYNLNGSFKQTHCVFRDITDQKKAEEALLNIKNKLAKIIEQTPMSMVITDMNKNIEYLNNKFVEVFGYTLDDISTLEKWWQVAYPDPDYRLQVKKSWETATTEAIEIKKQIKTQEWRFVRKDRKTRIVEFDMMPLDELFIISMNDITERKQAENDIKDRIEELEIFHEAAVDREIVVNKLRKEINDLLKQFGKEEKYEIVT